MMNAYRLFLFIPISVFVAYLGFGQIATSGLWIGAAYILAGILFFSFGALAVFTIEFDREEDHCPLWLRALGVLGVFVATGFLYLVIAVVSAPFENTDWTMVALFYVTLTAAYVMYIVINL